MKRNQLQTKGGRMMKIAVAPLVLILSLAATAVAQPNVVNAIPAAALSFASVQAPKGVKGLARVSLDGPARYPHVHAMGIWPDLPLH